MNKYTIIEICFFISAVITVMLFLIGIFLAFYLNNEFVGIVSFVIFLSLAAIIFFFANIFESLGIRANKK